MKTAFAKNLISARKFYRLTQRELANMVGIKRTSIGAYEEGRANAPFQTFGKICKALHVKDAEAFMNDENYIHRGENVKEWQSEIEIRYKMLEGPVKKAVDILLGF